MSMRTRHFLNRVKGDKLNLSHSRSLAVEKRKKTLLQEYRRVRSRTGACHNESFRAFWRLRGI